MVARPTPILTLALVLACTACTRERTLAPDDAFVVLMDASPGNLDQRFGFSDYGVKISKLIFSGLVTTDTATGEAEFDLATAIRNPSDTVYEIDIRTDALFHDGEPLTVDDVIYTFTSLDEAESPRARTFSEVEVTALDEDTVRFELPEPRATFIHDIATGIVPEHVLRPQDHQWRDDQQLIGSGPYRFVGRRGEHEIVIERFDGYYGTPAELRSIVFRLVRDDNSRVLAMLSGSAHLTQNTIPPLLLPVVERYEHLTMERAPSFKITYIIFNMRHEILASREVRQALALAIDRREIIDQKFLGMAQPATGLLAPAHWAYEEDVPRYDYDLERAGALLDSAGYPAGPDGVRFSLVFKVSSNKFRRSIALLIGNQLARVGIDVEVQAYEWGTFFYDVRNGNFELATLQWPNINDPDHYHYIFHSESIPTEENGGSGANRGRYQNAEMDRLIDRGRRTLGRDARRAIYSEIQQIAAEDVPYVNLWHEDNYVVRHREVSGYEMVPNARFTYLPRAHWREHTGHSGLDE